MEQFSNGADEAPDRHLVGRLRSRSGCVNEVKVLDLSVAGCLIERRALPVKVDDRVLLQLPGLRYQSANVAWIDEDGVGLTFEELLHEVVVQHLQRSVM